jgi:hypothetical protein
VKGKVRTSLSTITAAVMLLACASKGPVSSTEIASANPGSLDGTSSESQRLIDNASKQMICRRQRVTVSRLVSVVCHTRAEWKAQRERSDEVMREIQTSAASRHATPPQPSQLPPANTP